MGGPGSGGFRGWGWPPGSQDQPGSKKTAVVKATKKAEATRALHYRKRRSKVLTERDYALKEARRYCTRAPTTCSAPKGWRKFKATAENAMVVVAMHHTLPLWLRCKVLERTASAKKLVVVKIIGKLSSPAVDRRISGPRPKLRKVMAFQESALWMK